MKKNINVPNALSLARILFLPLLYVLILYDLRTAFLLAYLVIGATDALDGFIARKFNLVTNLGKDLDAVADLLLYISTAVFIYMLYPTYIEPHLTLFYLLMGVILLSLIVALIFAKKPIIMHTHILRLCAVMVYSLMFFSYFLDTNLYLATIIILYIIGFSESICMFVFYGDVDPDTRSIFHLMRKTRDLA
ncbi:MAG: CDP-alcohol phosphatidyltransferase family protein [Acholeplasmatales bacterium]|nr:MAG: CDP-alcohol phosphatidyltransferase family protein [Acholeplasmatales bacterium]